MHAVLGIWSVDESRRADSERLLRDEVVPQARARPGFVAGYWMHDPETGRNHTTIVFADRDAALGYRALVERGTRRAAQAGLLSEVLTTVEIVADAHPQEETPCTVPPPSAPA